MPTYVDDLGEPLNLDGPPSRVVSLVPSLTEAVVASYGGSMATAEGRETEPGGGAGHPLVGVTDWCTHPIGLDVPRIGGTKNPDVSRIIGLLPDLVIANEEENRVEHVEALRQAGVAVWVSDIRDLPSALDGLDRLLEVLGAPERGWLDLARSAWAAPEPVDPTRPLRALIPIWRRPWMALGSTTYAGDVLARLGVHNVLAAHAERYPRLDPVDLLTAREEADLVVLPDEPYAFTAIDGPEAFPGLPVAFVDGRALTWYGPAMIGAPDRLRAQLRHALGPPPQAARPTHPAAVPPKEPS